MTKRIGFWGTGMAAAALLAVAMSGGGAPAEAQQPGNHAAIGSYLYKTYCATCHGTAARGDGPLAESMRRRPANLTEIAKRNKGTFDRTMVFNVIDGRAKVPGHGGPDMPVWGDAFMRTSETSDEASVKHRIDALVDYLETLQAQDVQ